MTYERFVPTYYHAYYKREPFVSILKHGVIAFNGAIVKKHNLAEYKFYILLSDEEEKRLGVIFTSDKKESCISKIPSDFAKKGYLSLGVASFLSSCGIDYRATKKNKRTALPSKDTVSEWGDIDGKGVPLKRDVFITFSYKQMKRKTRLEAK